MKKKIKILDKLLMLIIILFTMGVIAPSNVSASEINETITENQLLECELVETMYGTVVIEKYDSNIQIIVKEIFENSNDLYKNNPLPLRLNQTNTWFDFTGSLTGRSRYYSGNHFSVDIITSSTSNSNFNLYLRKSNFINTTVGSVQLPQNGSFHIEFLHVNSPGSYHFDFNQAFLGVGHQTGNMTIWDWL